MSGKDDRLAKLTWIFRDRLQLKSFMKLRLRP